MRIIVVLPGQVKPAPAFRLDKDDAYYRLDALLNSSERFHIDATYEGRFDAAFVWRNQERMRVDNGQSGQWQSDRYDGRIVLRRVTDIWARRVPQR